MANVDKAYFRSMLQAAHEVPINAETGYESTTNHVRAGTAILAGSLVNLLHCSAYHFA